MLSIRPVLSKDNNYAHLIGTEFRMVKWGEQHFLIPPDDLTGFAYAVHSGAESEIVNYFSRREDRSRVRRGLPKLPPKFTKYLKMAPIVARITTVDPHHGKVTLSVGLRNKVREGMIFFSTPRKGAQFSIRVTKVSETESEGQIWTAVDLQTLQGAALTSKIPKGPSNQVSR